jgi:hypothetical protein
MERGKNNEEKMKKKMEEKHFRERYETPWADVRGVFLLEGIAEATSVIGDVKQDGWSNGGSLTPLAADDNGDLYLGF